MRNKSRSIALRIAQIINDNSSDEIFEAIAILKLCGSTSELLSYLALASKNSKPTGTGSSSHRTRKSKPIDQITSKAVLDLEKTDPDKYETLLHFDRLVRQGKVLETSDMLRRFGETVSEDFRPRTSRKGNISELMTQLATLPQEEMVKVIEKASKNTAKRSSDGFQELASFLIEGKRR